MKSIMQILHCHKKRSPPIHSRKLSHPRTICRRQLPKRKPKHISECNLWHPQKDPLPVKPILPTPQLPLTADRPELANIEDHHNTQIKIETSLLFTHAHKYHANLVTAQMVYLFHMSESREWQWKQETVVYVKSVNDSKTVLNYEAFPYKIQPHKYTMVQCT